MTDETYQQTGYPSAGTYETEPSGWTSWIVFADPKTRRP